MLLGGLGPGTYALTLQDGDMSRSVYVEVGEDDLEGVEIREREGQGVFRATVRGLERGRVVITPVSDAPQPLQASSHWFGFENGRFEVGGLAEGRYRVEVIDEKNPSRLREAEVDLSERHEAEIVFEFDS